MYDDHSTTCVDCEFIIFKSVQQHHLCGRRSAGDDDVLTPFYASYSSIFPISVSHHLDSILIHFHLTVSKPRLCDSLCPSHGPPGSGLANRSACDSRLLIVSSSTVTIPRTCRPPRTIRFRHQVSLFRVTECGRVVFRRAPFLPNSIEGSVTSTGRAPTTHVESPPSSLQGHLAWRRQVRLHMIKGCHRSNYNLVQVHHTTMDPRRGG